MTEEEYNAIEQFEDGSGPSEELMLQRHHDRMAEEEAPNPEDY